MQKCWKSAFFWFSFQRIHYLFSECGHSILFSFFFYSYSFPLAAVFWYCHLSPDHILFALRRNHIIFISATSICRSYALVTATASFHTALLVWSQSDKIFLLLWGVSSSHTSLLSFFASCSILLESLILHPPGSWTVDPRYLNSLAQLLYAVWWPSCPGCLFQLPCTESSFY